MKLELLNFLEQIVLMCRFCAIPQDIPLHSRKYMTTMVLILCNSKSRIISAQSNFPGWAQPVHSGRVSITLFVADSIAILNVPKGIFTPFLRIYFP